MMKVLLLFTIALIGSETGVYAEQLKSVKEFYKPEETKEEKNNVITDNPIKNDEQAVRDNDIGIGAWDFIKMILATAFVIALLYYLLKFINKKSRTFKSSQIVENLGGTTLGANRSVQIIKVGNRVLVLGVGENIQLLKEIDDEEESRQIIKDYNNKIEQLVQPSDFVTKVIQRTRDLKIQNTEKDMPSFPSLLKKQLEDMSNGRKQLFEELEKKGSEKR